MNLYSHFRSELSNNKVVYGLLFFIFFISLFINLYKIDTLMLFFGDAGRDYLAAWELILFHKIPLVGIPSSVVWLHQGPVSIYLISFALAVGSFHPVAPAIFYGIVGAISTILVFFLGRTLFNTKVGLFSALFFATSPQIIVNARSPYHTALIPFFATIFFLLLYKVLKGNKKLLFWAGLSYGLLLEVELSNAVLFLVFVILIYLYKSVIKRTDFVKIILGFLLGILPFILYDITHNFVQLVGFPLWIINRIRLFLGLTITHNATTEKVPSAVMTIINQLASIIFPQSYIILFFVLFFIFIFLYSKRVSIVKKEKGLVLILLLFIIPVIGYTVHAAPSPAYFPVLFPVASVLFAITAVFVIKRFNFLVAIVILLMITNVYNTISNDYYVNTKSGLHFMPAGQYNNGYSWTINDNLAKIIVKDANGRPFSIVGGGPEGKIQTNFDNLRYLVLWRKGNLKSDSKLQYIVYQEKKYINKLHKLVYISDYGSIARYENK